VFHLQRTSDGLAIVTLDNGAGHTRPTTLGRAAFESLASLLDTLEREGAAGLLLTGKPYVFCAGADLDELPGVAREGAAAAAETSRAGQELFRRLAALPFPTVAAINGACVGGGLELALHCRFRTISAAVRHLGLPECSLGIVPGWGGTQLTPRLVGPKVALEVAVTNPMRQNRLLGGAAAFERGFADRLFGPADFLDESLAYLRELVRDGVPERPEPAWDDLDDAVRRARARLDDAVHGAAPAPYRALELVAGARDWSLDEGYRRETEAIAELLPGRRCRASFYAYFLVERRAKEGLGKPEAEPAAIGRIGIVGAGVMATQIAALCLRRLQCPIVISDVRPEAVEEAIASLEDPRRQLVAAESDVDYAGCGLVIEAVVEDLDVKKDVFARLEEVVGPDCVLATNTSALSVGAIAGALAHPERVVGLHFFNPVAVMPLVEVVRAEATGDEALATAFRLALDLRKRPVVCTDRPGFVVNRILTRLLSTNLAALEQGVSVEAVDAAMLSLGLPMAPSTLLQMVGPKVAGYVLETLHAAYPDRFPLSSRLAALAAGRDEPAFEGLPGRALPAREEIVEATLTAMADEIGHLLAEGVVGSIEDVDTCLILGAGFPLFLGGISKELEDRGLFIPAPAV
jgi:3-hydroxyacyl-CoA dehydrogenase/enoyl-CoA hydratase/carnithine racemase